MRILPLPLVSYMLLVVLIALVAYLGVLPAFTKIDTDFPNYYTSARIVLEGKDVSRLYDDRWFQEQMQRYQMPSGGKFSPFSPTTALYALPLGMVRPQTALRLLTLVNLVGVLLCIIFLAHATSFEFPDVAVFVLLAGIGLINCLRFGQWYILLSLAIIGGYVLYQNGRLILSGICFGLMVPVKYFPLLFILYFAARKEWTLVIAALATSTFMFLCGLIVLGWDVHYTFFTTVLGDHLLSHYSLQSPFTGTFQSIDSLLHQLLVYDAEVNPLPAVAAADLLPQVKWGLIALLVAITILSIFRSRTYGASASVGLSIALLGLLGLLISPGGATYHFVLLWLPCALILQWLQDTEQRVLFIAAVASYALIGCIPYSIFRQFEGHGWLSLIAFPRLGLLLLLFLISVLGVWAPATRNSSGRIMRE